MISNSGQTEEVMRLVPHFKRLGLPLIGLLGNPHSELWEVVDYALDVSVSREACPLNLAPTTSILATVAMADALAVSLMRARDFQPEDFTRTHPGGTLGRHLSTEVRAAMRTEGLPLLTPNQTLRQALPIISESRLGMGIVVESNETGSKSRPIGIVTDGDVRRALEAEDNALELPITRLMSLDPITISPDATVADAKNRMLSLKVKALLVTNEQQRLLGIIDIFEF
jgi:arabinose-5-phosphate isomerase